MYDSIKLIPLLPLLGFLFVGLFGSKFKNEKIIGIITTSTVLGGFLIAFNLFLQMLSHPLEKPVIVNMFTWIETGDFKVNYSFQVDQLSILFTMIITGIGSLIHIYSIGYMHGDRSFFRFFAYLNLFIFMMLNLVLGSNYLVTFLGWEGVGLASYLLIGFWYDQKFPGYRIKWTGDAANKAFIVNRIGDFGFLIAMFLIFVTFNTLDYSDVKSQAMNLHSQLHNGGLITAIALLMFLGCTGKSAQIPLAGWLPDAMAGPTSVSALIHAATMVTAGIFLICRNSVIFSLSPTAMAVVAGVGAATALLAATIGIVQNDIKKVLAYSTVSQLGFMFTALGVGAFTAGLFHVMTHAFFKGLMFLGAGSVIHGMHHEQNIKKMGGLKKYMPITYWTFLIGTLAIAGIPFFSGFFSKDEILWKAFEHSPILWLVLAIAAFCTAFYMFRLVYLTFLGNERFDHHHVHPHESPSSMTIPLIILAVLSALGGFLGVPHALGFHSIPNLFEHFLEPIFADAAKILSHPEHTEVQSIEYILMAFSTCVAIIAIFLANKFYNKDFNWTTPRKLVQNLSFPYKVLDNKWYLDNFYYAFFVTPIYNSSKVFLWKVFDVKMIDGTINGTGKFTEVLGETLRKLQSGIAQNYALLMMLGIIVILAYISFGF